MPFYAWFMLGIIIDLQGNTPKLDKINFYNHEHNLEKLNKYIMEVDDELR